MTLISIVTTLYCSESYLEEFYNRIKNAVTKLSKNYEIIFVDDGSPDNSLKTALKIQGQDSNITVLELSRNFGHHKAIMTGLSYAQGDLIYLVDCDLEEEPEWILPFYEKMEKENCDVVYGIQETRKGGWFEKVSGFLFYAVYQKLAGADFPKNITTSRLMTRNYVASLIQHRERELMLGGLFHITGYTQAAYTVKKLHSAHSTYNWTRKVSLLTNAIISFSSTPLVFIFYFGFIMAFISSFFIINLLFSKFILGQPPAGWTSILVSIWFLGGITILCIGLIGIYISKIFIETKNRPYTIIKKIHSSQ